MLRIISGHMKGRKLQGPPEGFLGIRPTRDHVRQAMFNVLEAQGVVWQGSCGLDLYAGTGALGIEAASRGAERVVWVERQPVALDIVQKNLMTLGLGPNAQYSILPVSVPKALEDPRLSAYLPLDWIFLDPPFIKENTTAEEIAQVMRTLFQRAEAGDFFKPEAWICMEVEDKDEDFVKGLLDESFKATVLFKIKQFGRSSVFFWQVRGSA